MKISAKDIKSVRERPGEVLFFAALFGFDLFGQFLALAGLVPLVHNGLGDLVSLQKAVKFSPLGVRLIGHDKPLPHCLCAESRSRIRHSQVETFGGGFGAR